MSGESLSREQLLHLVDRAERGVLTAGEARLLRDGVLRLLAASGPVQAAGEQR